MMKFNFKTVEEVDIYIEKCQKAIDDTNQIIEKYQKVSPKSPAITLLSNANASREKHLESLVSCRESLLAPSVEVIEEVNEVSNEAQEIEVDDEANS